MSAVPASAAPWVKGFVVGSYEYAFRYGGRADFNRTGEIEPGIDCPHGSSIFFSNETQARIAISRQPWRSQREIELIMHPPGFEQTREPATVRRRIMNRVIAYRGYKRGIETYVNPWAADDPGQPQVTSRIGDGFNLDGKAKPADFVSPDGEKGIDNALYRAWGCDAPWRGNGNATLDMRANDKMQEGLYTMVIRVSGHQDPMNDKDAVVEIGYSPDKIVRDARSGVAMDYSYRIVTSAQYTRLKATIRNGVVETEQVEHLHMPRIAWFYDQTGDANFARGKIKLKLSADGLSGTGLIGGYRNWRDLYAEDTFAQDGGQQGIREHEDHVALYYALRRNADGLYNEKTGKYDGISAAYRIRMAAAYVVSPDTVMDIPRLAQEEERKQAFEAIKAHAILGAETRVPQPVPPGTSEASFPSMEHYVADLPSRDYFLKNLDRPHYAGEDAEGYPPWAPHSARPKPLPAPQKPQQQVRNEADQGLRRFYGEPVACHSLVAGPPLAVWNPAPERLNTFQINATVAAGGVLLLSAVFVMSRILPGVLWALVLVIALWPSYLKVRSWGSSAGWQRLGAPLLLTLLIGILVAAPVVVAAVEMVRESESLLGWINDARAHGVPEPASLNQLPWVGEMAASWWKANLATPEAASVFFAGFTPRSLLGLTRNIGPELAHRLLLFAITLLTLFFLFRDGKTLGDKVLSLAEQAFGNRCRSIVAHVVDAVHGTVDGLVLVGFAEGLVIGVGYFVTGVPHPIAFSIATSILAAIPFGAPLIFCVAALLLVGLGKAMAGIGLAVFGFVIVFITDHVVRPAVIGGAARIPFLLVLLGILGGLSSLGMVGLFVGPALMAVFVAVWRDLSEEPAKATPAVPG